MSRMLVRRGAGALARLAAGPRAGLSLAASLALGASLGPPAAALPQKSSEPAAATAPTPVPAPPADLDEAAVVARCVELLLAMQEDYDDPKAETAGAREWPYEGVYKVPGTKDGKSARVIPAGYRVGGTSIVCWALVTAPGYARNEAAQAAVARGLAFVIEFLQREDMRPGFADRYDVRGWGHTYALWLMLQLRAHDAVPEGRAEDVAAWIPSLVDTLEATEIRPGGGWNYSRGQGFEGEGNRASPFMTGPTLLALFEARRQGFDVDAAVVDRALVALEKTRLHDGEQDFSYGYSRGDTNSGRPGAMGRITAAEVALFLAGRSNAARLASGVECFVTHWDQLEVRRRKDRTHEPPYGVAPYYVYFAHYHAALAIALLPEEQRAPWRVKYLGRLFQSRQESGGWNDRVFDRSESYGTAMAALSLLAPTARPPARWEDPKPAGGGAEGRR